MTFVPFESKDLSFYSLFSVVTGPLCFQVKSHHWTPSDFEKEQS